MGQEHLVSILPPWRHRSMSHVPKMKYNHPFFWRRSKCICVSPPARTVPHCLEWLEGKQIGIFQLSRMFNAERRWNWRKISCKLWCYVGCISWKLGGRSEEFHTQHWALRVSFQVPAMENWLHTQLRTVSQGFGKDNMKSGVTVPNMPAPEHCRWSKPSQ